MTPVLDRRSFLRAAALAGAGLVVPIRWPGLADAIAAGNTLAPNAYVRVDGAGVVTLVYPRSEMGQGSSTGLVMMLAEEIAVDPSRVRIEQAVPGPAFGDMTTGGSTTIREVGGPVRKAGAQAREMLVAAAARRWKVEARDCRAEQGGVVHAASGRQLGYGALAAAAAALPVPEDPPLKERGEFRVIGTKVPRLDLPAKVDGTAVYGMDVRVRDRLIASIERCPTFGGKPRTVDESAALAVPGVRRVVRLEQGVAVVASTTWAAFRGREALRVTWDPGPLAALDDAAIRERFAERAKTPGHTARKEGDGAAALAKAARTIEAVYQAPYLAHVTPEPQNCTAAFAGDRCEVWAPTQSGSAVQSDVAKALAIPPGNVRVNIVYSGGAFGRRAMADVPVEAALLSRIVAAPVQLVWTREDDLRHDLYRPASYHLLRAGLDGAGMPSVWAHRIVGPGIMAQISGRGAEMDVDGSSIMGAADLPYAVPNLEVDCALVDPGVPLGWWRSVGSSQNAYVVECFLDELARAAGRDPLEFRRALLKHKPRHLGALELAAARAGWETTPPAGRARGIAVHESFGSVVAHVAEVSLDAGRVRVHRLVCAVDCGLAVAPDLVTQQMEGAAVFALSPVLKSAVTIAGGGVAETGYRDHPLLTLAECPETEVHVVPSTEASGGVGEPGVPPVAPAVANAVFALTGKPVRSLPIRV